MRRGDTLIDILVAPASRRPRPMRRCGRCARSTTRAACAPGRNCDPRGERAADAGARRLLGLDFDLDFDHAVRVTRDADGRYAAAKVARPQRRDLLHRAGIIDDSLYLPAERAALPHDVTIGLIKLFSWDVDFQRDVRRGDQFETLFEVVSLEDGSADTRGGDLVYAGAVDRRPPARRLPLRAATTARSTTSTAPARACASSCCAPRSTARGCRRASACAGTRSSATP